MPGIYYTGRDKAQIQMQRIGDNMKIIEVKGDLFNTAGYTDKPVMFAHCIASDFGMHGGIATQFIEHFDMKTKLIDWAKAHMIPLNKNKRYTAFRPTLVGKAVRIENTYNLITKETTFGKPTMEDLTASLQDMKRQMVENKETVLAIPDMIGCGIDGLNRSQVLTTIQSIFLMTGITIYVVRL